MKYQTKQNLLKSNIQILTNLLLFMNINNNKLVKIQYIYIYIHHIF